MNKTPAVKVSKLSSSAKLPRDNGDGSYTLFADSFGNAEDMIDHVRLTAGAAKIIRTGLKIDVPQGHAVMLYTLPHHANSKDVRLSSGASVVLPGDDGELCVKLIADPPSSRMVQFEPLTLHQGDAVSIALVVNVASIAFGE